MRGTQDIPSNPGSRIHIVLHDPGGNCFFTIRTQTGWALPSIFERSSHFSIVHHIQRSTRQRLGLSVTVLRCLRYSQDRQTGCVDAVYEVEHHNPEEIRWADGRWVESERLQEFLGTDTDPHRPRLDPCGKNSGNEFLPWMKRGWFKNAERWIDCTLADFGMRRKESIIQLRCSAASSLLQAQTSSGAAVYLKACPPPSPRELHIAPLLAEMFVGRVAPVLSVGHEQNWMLMREVRGIPLTEVRCVETWGMALQRYAEMQIGCLSEAARLISMGVPDLGFVAGAARIGTSWNHLLSALASQPQWAQSEIEALHRIGESLRPAYARLGEVGIPCTIEHGDFHPYNVLVTSTGCTYLDWSELSIAHPFFSVVAFLRYVEHLRPDLRSSRQLLARAYLQAWKTVRKFPDVLQAWRLAETIAPAHYAASLWHELTKAGTDFAWEQTELSAALEICLRTLLRSNSVASMD